MIASVFSNDYLPISDAAWYALMIVADVIIIRFWWFLMKNLGDR